MPLKLEIFPKPPANWGILELREDLDCYSVVTFYPRQKDYSKPKGKLIWEYSSQSASSQAASDLAKNGEAGKIPQASQDELTAKSDNNIAPFGEMSTGETKKAEKSRFMVSPVWTGSAADYEKETRPYYKVPFAEGLKRVVDPSQKENRSPVFVSETPEVFRKIGFTALMDVNGQKVVVPVLIESENNIDGEQIDSHLVLTVYDSSDWVSKFLTPAIKSEKNGIGIYYFDKDKAGRYSALSKKEGSIYSTGGNKCQAPNGNFAI